MEVIKANRRLKKLKVVSNLLNISLGSHVVCRAQFENHCFESNTITNYFFQNDLDRVQTADCVRRFVGPGQSGQIWEGFPAFLAYLESRKREMQVGICLKSISIFITNLFV